jgi:uncharacterized protein CbrC (UPF0167 family)
MKTKHLTKPTSHLRCYDHLVKVTVQILDSLAEEARKRGVSVQAYVQDLIDWRTQEDTSSAVSREAVSEAVDAIDAIREFRKGNKLNGLKIKDLIHEGHTNGSFCGGRFRCVGLVFR